jgi:hypothetical protein
MFWSLDIIQEKIGLVLGYFTIESKMIFQAIDNVAVITCGYGSQGSEIVRDLIHVHGS